MMKMYAENNKLIYMKIIEPKVEFLKQESGLEGIYKQIERVGRTCYKSEDKITEDSAKPFVDRMINSKHLAMLEHGTVYLKLQYKSQALPYIFNSYSEVFCHDSEYYVTTNMRTMVENNWLQDLDYVCAPTEHHVKRISLKFTTSIGVSREGNRHRSFSIAEQSTRYCNYSKDKFNNEVTFTAPSWLSHEQLGNHNISTIIMQTEELLDCGNYKDEEFAELIYLNSCARAEEDYLKLIELGWKPQQAREVLPLSTATEVVYTGFEKDWKHFFDLRYRETTGKAHPNMKQIATMAHDLILKELNLDL